jgi:hypothetical protein
MFERWRGTLFWVCLFYGFAGTALAAIRIFNIATGSAGLGLREAVELFFRVGSAGAVLWAAFFVFRRPRSTN